MLLNYAAEDWLNPSAILEAFEARAIRMAVSSAQSLGDFPNPEEGDIVLMKLVLKLFFVSAISKIMSRTHLQGTKLVFLV